VVQASQNGFRCGASSCALLMLTRGLRRSGADRHRRQPIRHRLLFVRSETPPKDQGAAVPNPAEAQYSGLERRHFQRPPFEKMTIREFDDYSPSMSAFHMSALSCPSRDTWRWQSRAPRTPRSAHRGLCAQRARRRHFESVLCSHNGKLGLSQKENRPRLRECGPMICGRATPGSRSLVRAARCPWDLSDCDSDNSAV